MKVGKHIKNGCFRKDFEEHKFKHNSTFAEFKQVMKVLNTIRCEVVIEQEEGYSLPSSIGRIIILKNKPRVKNVYSMTRPGTKIFNLHSFGYIYRVYHKLRLIRYPELFKFRPHRQNIKVPLYNHIMNGTKEYYRQTDYIG